MRHNKSRSKLEEKLIKSEELDGQTGIWVTIRDLYADERIFGAPDHVVEERIARNKPRRKHVLWEKFFVQNGQIYCAYRFRDTRNRGYSMYLVWDIQHTETDRLEARLAKFKGGNDVYLGIFGQKRGKQASDKREVTIISGGPADVYQNDIKLEEANEYDTRVRKKTNKYDRETRKGADNHSEQVKEGLKGKREDTKKESFMNLYHERLKGKMGLFGGKKGSGLEDFVRDNNAIVQYAHGESVEGYVLEENERAIGLDRKGDTAFSQHYIFSGAIDYDMVAIFYHPLIDGVLHLGETVSKDEKKVVETWLELRLEVEPDLKAKFMDEVVRQSSHEKLPEKILSKETLNYIIESQIYDRTADELLPEHQEMIKSNAERQLKEHFAEYGLSGQVSVQLLDKTHKKRVELVAKESETRNKVELLTLDTELAELMARYSKAEAERLAADAAIENARIELRALTDPNFRQEIESKVQDNLRYKHNSERELQESLIEYQRKKIQEREDKISDVDLREQELRLEYIETEATAALVSLKQRQKIEEEKYNLKLAELAADEEIARGKPQREKIKSFFRDLDETGFWGEGEGTSIAISDAGVKIETEVNSKGIKQNISVKKKSDDS